MMQEKYYIGFDIGAVSGIGGIARESGMTFGVALDVVGLDSVEHLGVVFRFPDGGNCISRHGVEIKMDTESGFTAFFRHGVTPGYFL
jgi:hypothetical protein